MIYRSRLIAVRKRNFSWLSAAAGFEYIGSSMINPSTIFAHALELLNGTSGLGWPVSIAAFTFGMRSLLFPAYVQQMKASITASNLKNEVSAYQVRIQNFRSQGDIASARGELQNMYTFLRANNCSPGRTILLSLLPIPFFMSSFFALRGMASQPIESFLEGGAFWFSNLSAADPLFILPVLSSLTMLTSFEISHRINPVAVPQAMARVIRVAGLLSIPLLAYMPTSLCVYFISTNIFTLFQNLIVHNQHARRALKIPQLLVHPAKPDASPAASFKDLWRQISAQKQSPAFLVHHSKPVTK